jgi:pilus assembly protein FimV
MAIRASHILSCLLFALAGEVVHAAELGDAQLSSHIGQQLVADVELTLIEDTGNPVRVRLAHSDVYRGANIAMPPVLSTLNLSVTRRDGRQFLHLTTLKPVESRHLHVYLELTDGSQHGVRLVTLWLTPDPNPQPVAVPVPVSTPVSAPVVAAQPVTAAARPIAPLRKPAPATRPAAALHEGEEYVEAAAPTRAGPPRATVPKAAAAKKAVPPAPPAPRDAPAACAPQAAAAPVHACVALGEKNAALRHELGRLEEKMKVLQVAAGAAPAAAPVTAPAVAALSGDATATTLAAAVPGTATLTAPAPAATSPAAPKGAPRIQRKPKEEVPPEPETPWLPIAGGVAGLLALAGLAVMLLRRRKSSSFGKIPKEQKPAKLPAAAQADAEAGTPKPGLMAAVKARLMPGSRKQPAPPVEPSVESAETQQQ